MPEGLSPQERIDLGSDDKVEDDLPLVIEGTNDELREWLLREPYFEAGLVRSFVETDDLEPLIMQSRLLAYTDHGDYLFPAFQFDPQTMQPLEVVAEVDKIMESATDGWGVTGWWLQKNTRLGTNEAGEYLCPKDLLEHPNFHPILIQLAESIGNDDSY